MPLPPLRPALAAAALAVCLAAAPGAARQAYYPDDPIAVDPETEDASGVRPWSISDPYDFLANTFTEPGDRSRRRAVNVNTIDEVPDSSWFTNRALARPLTAADIARGPDESDGPATGPWTVVSGKADGITPGVTVRDTAGVTWFIKFDPPANPEMATGAEMIATKLFWALGYHVPENHLAVIDRARLDVAPDATARAERGHPVRLTEAAVDRLMRLGARRADGRYRVIASRALAGRPLGPFRYHGTRPDDPNDIFPHEHRRELRGLRASAAWLNHDDSRSINSLDTLVDAGGRALVRHHLIDFGSTLGSGSVSAQRRRAGNEYLWELKPTLLTMVTLGFWVRPWITVDYPELLSVGRFEAAFFEPEAWKPEYPNPAFANARGDDLFWAARRIMAIDDDGVRAAVATAAYSDPQAAAYVASAIIARRDKVGLAWLTAVNPLVDFSLAADGVLTFDNAAVRTARATPASGYAVRWSRVDNATGAATPAGAPLTVPTPRAALPAALAGAAFVRAEVGAIHDAHPGWARPVRVTFRRVADGWRLVGLDRLPHEDTE
ncbi:MAG: hypothetical protein AB7N90_03755 [Vicinamibacterales bacterium]